jgi:hypothetical protein
VLKRLLGRTPRAKGSTSACKHGLTRGATFFRPSRKRESMTKVIIALLILMFGFVFLLLIWIIFLSLALLLFSRKEKKGTTLRPKIKGD